MMHAGPTACQMKVLPFPKKLYCCGAAIGAGVWATFEGPEDCCGSNCCADCWVICSTRSGTSPRYKVAIRLSARANPRLKEIGVTGTSLRDSFMYMATIIRK